MAIAEQILFIDCSEAGTFSFITDAWNGLTLTPDGLASSGDGTANNVCEEGDANSVRMQQYFAIPLSGQVPDIGNKDFVLTYLCKVRRELTGPPVDACTGIYIGGDGSGIGTGIRSHSYGTNIIEGRYSGTSGPIALGDQVARTGYYPESGYTETSTGQLGNIVEGLADNFTDGELVSITAVKRGNTLEHYIDESLTGVWDVAATISDGGEYLGYWNNQIFRDLNGDPVNTHMYIAHSTLSSNTSAWEYPQDYYGIMLLYYPPGEAPDADTIRSGIRWNRDQWPVGNKTLYNRWSDTMANEKFSTVPPANTPLDGTEQLGCAGNDGLDGHLKLSDISGYVPSPDIILFDTEQYEVLTGNPETLVHTLIVPAGFGVGSFFELEIGAGLGGATTPDASLGRLRITHNTAFPTNDLLNIDLNSSSTANTPTALNRKLRIKISSATGLFVTPGNLARESFGDVEGANISSSAPIGSGTLADGFSLQVYLTPSVVEKAYTVFMILRGWKA